MNVLCLISYTDPDGVVYEAGQLYQVEPEVGIWLTLAAEGQFKVVDDSPAANFENERRGPANGGDADAAPASARSATEPPADRMVKRAPRLRQAQPPARGR